MEKTISFWKMEGSGNDFVIIDNRKKIFREKREISSLAKGLCLRKKGVGADGLLVVEESDLADFRCLFFNPDGSEAEMCGNGGRSVARYAFESGIAGQNTHFETLAGIIEAKIMEKRVRLLMPCPKNLRLDEKVRIDSLELIVSSINTGVPHAVIYPEDPIENIDIKRLGRSIRGHQAFAPHGTNVNFLKVIDKSSISIRTYERGVEDETLSCGTGSIASALISSAKGFVVSPVEMRTWGGEILRISFKKDGEVFSDVRLEGDTNKVFEGKIELEK